MHNGCVLEQSRDGFVDCSATCAQIGLNELFYITEHCDYYLGILARVQKFFNKTKLDSLDILFNPRVVR